MAKHHRAEAAPSSYASDPFDGVSGRKPEPAKSDLRVSVAEMARRIRKSHPAGTPPKTPPHVPPKAQPWSKVDTTEEPRDLEHALQMREALKARVDHLGAVLRTLRPKHPERPENVARIQATFSRLGELTAWVRARALPPTREFDKVAIVRSLLDVIDRAEDGGFRLTDDEVDAVNLAAEFQAHSEKARAARAAIRDGEAPPIDDES